MKHLPSSIIFFLLLAVSVSCGRKNDNLDCARRLMDSMPDSALTILQSVDTSTLSSPSDRAAYSLLLSRALDKNYMDLTSDSIARIAYNFYCIEGHGTDDERMEAAFSMAIICSNGGNDLEGLRYAKEAELYGENSNDFLTRGLIYRLERDLVSKSRNNGLALTYIEQALDCFKLLSNNKYYNFALIDKANTLSNLGEYLKSLNLLDSLSKTTDDVVLMNMISDASIIPLIGLSMKDNAKLIIEEKIKKKPLDISAQEYALLGKLCYLEGNISEGDEHIQYAFENLKDFPDSIAYFNAKIAKYTFMKNNDSLLLYSQAKNDLIFNFNSKEFDVKSVLLSDQNETVKILHLRDNIKGLKQNIISLFIVFTIIILVLISYFYFYRTKLTSEKKKFVYEHNSQISNISCQYKNRYFKDINNLLSLKLNVLTDASHIKDMFDEAWFEDVAAYIDKTEDNTFSNLIKAYPDCKKLDKEIFIVSHVGIPIDISCIVFDLSRENFNNRKSRLKKQIYTRFNLKDYKFGDKLKPT